jgi:hypothetical protein
LEGRKTGKRRKAPFKTAAAADMAPDAEIDPVWTSLFLAALTVICIVPFLTEAFHIDDPLFLWTARHIQSHPFDFYGFKVNWYGTEMLMTDVTKNPPLAAYYIAVIASIFGWSEVALHAAFLLPAIGVVTGSFFLARSFCTKPAAAALFSLLSPAFLLSSTSIMCYTLMLCFWVWALFYWVQGIKQKRPVDLAIASGLVVCCCFTKYFGISLLPLMIIYAAAKERKAGHWIWHLLVPIVALVAFQSVTFELYGRGLLADAAGYATLSRHKGHANLFIKASDGLAFIGGCLLPVLVAAFWIWPRRRLVQLALFAVAALVPPYMNGSFGRFGESGFRWLAVIEMAVFIFGGASLLLLAARAWWEQRDPDSLLLMLWCAGTFFFAAVLNWSVNGRSVLPMAPAAAILLVRQLDRAKGWWTINARTWLVPLGFSAFIAFWVTWGDFRMANSARTAAIEITDRLADLKTPIWFQGHWGVSILHGKEGRTRYRF